MVQMHPLSPSTTGVSFEAEGGIRNPACQDDDLPESKPPSIHHHRHHRQQQQQQQQSVERETHDGGVRLPPKKIDEQYNIHEKSEELQEIMTVCRTRVPWKFSGNLFIIVIVLIIISFGEFGFIPSQRVGFYCNDPKISFKFTGDSISATVLVAVTMIVPALVMWATEWSCYSSESYKSLECSSSSRGRQFWQWYGYYTLGWCYLLFIVEIVKVVVGEPRPHFFDSCKPKEIDNCTNEYRRMYTCTNTELSWFYVSDSDKSFPSGHSALSFFTGTFLVWYLQSRMPNRLVLLMVKPWLQCLAILWAIGCSMSRITDNRHHWWDVLVGATMGLAYALFVARITCRGFKATPSLADSLADASPNGVLPSVGYVPNPNKRHQSIKKLLSNGSNCEMPEGRELGDMPATWTA